MGFIQGFSEDALILPFIRLVYISTWPYRADFSIANTENRMSLAQLEAEILHF